MQVGPEGKEELTEAGIGIKLGQRERSEGLLFEYPSRGKKSRQLKITGEEQKVKTYFTARETRRNSSARGDWKGGKEVL